MRFALAFNVLILALAIFFDLNQGGFVSDKRPRTRTTVLAVTTRVILVP